MTTHGMTLSAGNLPEFVLSAGAALTYVTDPEVWPQFVAYVHAQHPGAAADDLADRRLRIMHHAHELYRAWIGQS